MSDTVALPLLRTVKHLTATHPLSSLNADPVNIKHSSSLTLQYVQTYIALSLSDGRSPIVISLSLELSTSAGRSDSKVRFDDLSHPYSFHCTLDKQAQTLLRTIKHLTFFDRHPLLGHISVYQTSS